MTNKELLEEIRMNRTEIQRLHKDFFFFKGKAFGFLSVVSLIINIGIAYLTGKFKG